MHPEKAIRELVANALIHQDFTVTWAVSLTTERNTTNRRDIDLTISSAWV